MPWKEKNTMNLRCEFALRALQENILFKQLCDEFNIAQKTGYKWKKRFIEQGLAGLKDQTRRPKNSPRQLDENCVCEIINLKQAHKNWGPRKIRELYARKTPGQKLPSESSFKRVLQKAGLTQKRKRRKSTDSGRLQNRIEAKQPNDIWTVDFKGWWYTTDHQRCEPLTVRDLHSRFILCAKALENATTKTVRNQFEKLFKLYGLPRIIRSDNGRPFVASTAPLGLSKLAAWWIALGINKQNAALTIWRNSYNHERPHEALGMRLPSELYQKSASPYTGTPDKLEYPLGYQERKVSKAGQISIGGRQIRISEAHIGWNIGLKAEDEKHYLVYFGNLCLGQLDPEKETFQPLKQKEQNQK